MIAWGNERMEVRDTYSTHHHGDVDANCMMVQIGSEEAPRRPGACTRNGNEYTLKVTIPGGVFAHE